MSEMTCPHCGERLKKFRTPPESSWGERAWLVCFNDACPYFTDGWEHMREQYRVVCSYRYRFDPALGEAGPMVVYSAEMGLDHIVPD